jgi:hypothetical protein
MPRKNWHDWYNSRTEEDKEDQRLYDRLHWAKNKKHLNAKHRSYYKAKGRTPEQRSKNVERLKLWNKENGKFQKSKRLAANERKAGSKRPKQCEVCGRVNSRGIVFDHCHLCDMFRGWLCTSCNTILGFAHDNPKILLKLATYLKRHEGEHREGLTPDGQLDLVSRETHQQPP